MKNMVHFIYGRTGSGKSTFLLECAAATHAKHIFVLVPDRGAVMAERMFSYAPNAGDIDVVTFNRLSNFVFRKYGGICENYISRGAKKVIMHNTLAALSGLFASKGEFFESDTAATERFIAMHTELVRGAVTQEQLAAAAEGCEGEVGKKFADIAMLFTAFDAEVGERFEDPDGMLAKTNALLSKESFFRGSDVYIDQFNSFSKEQLATVREIMRSAENVYISVPYVPAEDKNTPCFFGIADTAKRLLETAEAAGAELAEPTVLLSGRRFENEELSFLSRNLFPGNGYVKAVYEKKPENVRVMSAANTFAEAEAVCLDIAKKVREGARYRDFAVIMRNSDAYTGVIDAMMRKYEIPCFISGRRDITELAFIKFMLSALSAAERGFARELIISYIKTDFAGITPGEINLFENYVRKWNISGARFYDEYEWNMNPDGFRGEMTQENEEKLIRLAEIRKKAVMPLRAFCEDTAGRHSVAWFAERLYNFAVSLSAPEKIALDAKEAEERGEKSLSAELRQLFSVFCDALDALVSACGSEEVGVAEFTSLLRLVLSETDIGKIPTSLDEVTVFDAQAGGYAGVKHAYIMGACEGTFPARVEDDGIFNDKEKEVLLKYGIEITSTVERRLCDELYYFYTAACAAAESVCFTYPVYEGGKKTRRSPALVSVKEMFPKLAEERFEDLEKTELLERAAASFEYILRGNDAFTRALRDYYESSPEYAEKTRYIGTPLSSYRLRIPEEDARKIFPKNISTSYSRLEKYIVCNFSYFCEYELKLKDNIPVKFGAVDIGNFMHKMLELTVRYALYNPDATDEEMREQIETECKRYLEAVCRGSYAEISPRIAHIGAYLSHTCEKFVRKFREEFRESKFTPKDFEITIGKGGDIEPIRLVGESGGVELRGKIDRVDTYEGGDGKIYIRVADYKTGSKKFDLKNIEAGRDLQMLLYLYSICENGERRYGKDIAPAGVLYVSVKPASETVKLGVETPAEDENGNSGLFLDNDEVLKAMEPGLEGRFIPVTAAKGGKKKGNLMAAEEFAALKETVVETVIRASEEMRGGKADAEPCEPAACEYCKMKAVCRTKKK
ncbi:MAG: PD-(D/E)XK nuclease family protein [Clostridia bacterium]|nr:PD-(D/E)XK nuclease family protein [Clostridia bacterium]